MRSLSFNEYECFSGRAGGEHFRVTLGEHPLEQIQCINLIVDDQHSNPGEVQGLEAKGDGLRCRRMNSFFVVPTPVNHREGKTHCKG